MQLISMQVTVFLAAGAVMMTPNIFAAPSFTGTLGINGEIVEAPCAIHPEYNQQKINIKDISVDKIIHEGAGEWHPFSIRLINCGQSLGNYNGTVTFEGEAKGSYFMLQGDSRGLAIEVKDENGKIIRPGIATLLIASPHSERQLNYSLRLTGTQEKLEAGQHFALLKYRLDYY